MMASLSPFIIIPASILMVASGLIVLAASIGIVRVNNFLSRVHIQAIIYSTALWCLLLASLLLTFSLKDRTFLHEIVIGLFIFITSPVSTILLVRSFVLREERSHLPPDTPGQDTAPVQTASEAENERVAAQDVASIEAELEMEPEEQEPAAEQQRPVEPGPQSEKQSKEQAGEQPDNITGSDHADGLPENTDAVSHNDEKPSATRDSKDTHKPSGQT